MNKIIPILGTLPSVVQQAFCHPFTFRADGLHTDSFQQHSDLGRCKARLQQQADLPFCLLEVVIQGL